MSAIPFAPTPDARFRGIRLSKRRAALILVLVTVFAALAGSWLYLGSGPARQIATLASGQFTLEVPLITQYVLPAVISGAASETVVGLSGTEPFTFRWLSSASDGSAVQFVFRPRAQSPFSFEDAGEDAFVYREIGRTGFGNPNAGQAEAWVYTWRMDYVARRMAAYDGFFERTWIEILFSPPDSLVGGAFVLPYANVSVPGSADLLPTGVVDSLSASGNWTYERRLSDFGLPANPFRHRIAPISIAIGSGLVVSAILESSFLWGPAGEYTARTSGSGNVDVTITWYWDARFGGLFPVVSQPYGG